MTIKLIKQFQKKPKRHPFRNHLECYWESIYRGYCVQQYHSKGSQVKNYLDASFVMIKYLQNMHNHIFGFRIDLHIPKDINSSFDDTNNVLIRKFLYSLQRELYRSGSKHSTRVHAIWAREKLDWTWVDRKRKRGDKILDPDAAKPHYHVLILLNGDSFNRVGSYKPTQKANGEKANGEYLSDTMAHRVIRAWSYALGKLSHCHMPGLVEFCKQIHFEDRPATKEKPARRIPVKKVATYNIRRSEGPSGLVEIMYAVSYLCKAYSKDLSEGVRCFQTTQVPKNAAQKVWDDERDRGPAKAQYGTPRALTKCSENEALEENEDNDLDW